MSVLVGSSNAGVGLEAGMAMLRAGASALDAVEAVIKIVESNPEDHTVGLGGLPNMLGVVELDASIMDGRTLACGAVAGVRGFEHPISIARHVMTDLPHVFLVGEGAERFARECGFTETELLTDEARAIYEDGLRGRPEQAGRAYASAVLRALVERSARLPERASGKDAGTVNVLALDDAGNLASGVSTSGFAWKYPGRAGDTPVIGAGNYCDNRYGAAACTGRGEMAIRCASAHSVVFFLRAGRTPQEAGAAALQDLDYLEDAYASAINCVVLDPSGSHAGFSSSTDATYVFMTDKDDAVQEVPRTQVRVKSAGAHVHKSAT